MSRSGANRRRMNNNGNGKTKIPLLPTAVNNKATMPKGENRLVFNGEEVIDIVQVTASTQGEVIFNRLVTPNIVARLSTIATIYQRIRWKTAEVHIVPLNGSTTTSGYTAGFVEDPEIVIPSGKELIRFLTAMRSTVVRQAWVGEEAGKLVAPNNLPEMYTQAGSDIRRWAIGRIVIAAGGNITNANFQVMLKYNVEVFVPVAISPDFALTDFFTAPQTTNNATLGNNSILLPQTRGNAVPFNADVILSSDMFVTGESSVFVGVVEPAIIRAGTSVRFVPVTIGANNYLSVNWDGKPDGESFYVTNVTNVPSSQYLTMNALTWTSLATQNFRTWVQRTDL